MIAFAIHAGAGNVARGDREPRRERACLATMRSILQEGFAQLAAGASSLDVVETAVRALEDYEEFNAGRGAVLTSAGTVELDAAIMDGRTQRAGAIAAVQTVRNPISGARVMLEENRHVLMTGRGAERICRQHGLASVPNEFFITERRRQQLARARSVEQSRLDHEGTVGAVARDARGHLAAATSTGGMTNKLPGRIGDSPLIGAGTWAADGSCAVSATGTGETIIRVAFAHEIHALLAHGKVSLRVACRRALASLARLGGHGGCIAVGRSGPAVLAMNANLMFRGRVDARGAIEVAVARGAR